MYAQFLGGVESEFILHVRKAPISMLEIRQRDPELWRDFEKACEHRLRALPYPSNIVQTIEKCFDGFKFAPETLYRSNECRSMQLEWVETDTGELVAVAKGPIETASHVETTLTQLVQEVIILAQIRMNVSNANARKVLKPSNTFAALDNREYSSNNFTQNALLGTQKWTIDKARDMLLGSAIARLALGVDFLNKNMGTYEKDLDTCPETMQEQQQNKTEKTTKIALFAGRRSSSRRYLLLQNWYCALHLNNFIGTSSILSSTLLPTFGQEIESETIRANANKKGDIRELHLVGTLAHEVAMMLEQLMGEQYDNIFRDSKRSQVTALLAHLLILRANGGLHKATALSDTFGTIGFIRTSLAAQIPEQFQTDMANMYPAEWSKAPNCIKHRKAKVFDLFRAWRLDSGDYIRMATSVKDAWDSQYRSACTSQKPPEPTLIHSNLSSYEEVVSVSQLPSRIRPELCAFGTLADGFLPNFPWEIPDDFLDQSDSEDNCPMPSECIQPPKSNSIKMTSVVMKALQAHYREKNTGSYDNSAGKLGDEVYEIPLKVGKNAKEDKETKLPKIPTGESKIQVDPRLLAKDRQSVENRLYSLASIENLEKIEQFEENEPNLISESLANAYAAVTRKRRLM